MPDTTAENPVSAAHIDAVGLAGGLAHELRNPLSTMMVNLRLLAEDLQDPQQDAEQLRQRALQKVDTLRYEAERLQSLCDDFLNLVGPRRLERNECDLNTIVKRLVEFFELLARRNKIDLVPSLSSSPVVCAVDENLIRQAVLNLMLNAQQAMPDGGKLEITTRREADGAVIEVSDTGVGIPPEQREKLMTPFFSTKSGGTGLGLAITRRIIEEHGGALTFESEVGKGTTFTVRLTCQ